MSLYDEFIVLCNAQHTICINDKSDSDEIVELIKMRVPDIHGFTLCILRESNSSIVADEYVL